MEIIEPGHSYLLRVLDGPPDTNTLLFVKREGPRFPGNIGSHSGTTSQEVLRALIDRAYYVYNQIPCWETWLSIPLMKLVVWLYELRASRIHKRPYPSISQAVYGKMCDGCNHWDYLNNNHGNWCSLKKGR